MANMHNNIWWGPPKKFTTQIAERKISWLELFYDLVYVIVISRITHYLPDHPSFTGLLDYSYLFAMTFWGWYNGSMYHDLHATPDIRNRFMTLWQMMAVGAFAVTLDSPPERFVFRATIALMFMQVFITYLWWSVGIYDKAHRKLNRPYTVCYLSSFGLLLLTLFIPALSMRIVFWIALVLNYLPFILTALKFRTGREDLSLSSNMTERLGLFVIIVFGEAILGVINSVGHLPELGLHVWFMFGMGILIVFALWWIFFSILADREAKKGMLAGTILSMLFIPAVASLGMVGAAFQAFLGRYQDRHTDHSHALQILFGISIAIFLIGITLISAYLEFPEELEKRKRSYQLLLVVVGFVNLILVLFVSHLSALLYLSLVLVTLLIVIVMITRTWARIEIDRLTNG